MTNFTRIVLGLLALLGLSFSLSLTQTVAAIPDEGQRSWRDAARHSAGIAPDPEQLAGVAMVPAIEAAIASYPHADDYRSYPGPNSNTFLAHIGREVPALKLDLPANAIGKDYRPLSRALGVSATGAGVQASLLGLLGLSVGVQEGVEFNLLGLNIGPDINRPGLRLPFVGRLGLDDRGESGARDSNPLRQSSP